MAPDEKSVEKFDELAPESASIQPDVQLEGSASAEERRLVRKLDGRILPIACLMYLFACQYYFGHFALAILTYRNDVRPGQNKPG